MKRVHICLVSDQPIPNMIPAFMDEFRPDKIVLIKTPEKSEQSNRLRAIFEKHKIEVEEKFAENGDYYTINNLTKNILNENKTDNILVNLTGGTKLMVLAAYNAVKKLRHKRGSVIYTDTDNLSVVRIYPDYERYNFTDCINVEDYLESYGYKIESEKTDDKYLRIGELIYQERENIFPEGKKKEVYNRIKYLLLNNGIYGVSGGFWLEYFTYYCVNDFIKGRDKLKLGVKIISSNGVHNELDVVFTYMNRLYVIECKVSDIKGISDKLYSVSRHVGGSFVKMMLVTSGKSGKYEVSKSKANNIKVVKIGGLLNFKEVLLNWIKE